MGRPSSKLGQQEQLFQLVLLQLGADDTQPAGIVGATLTDLELLRHQVEMEPGLPVVTGHHALGPEDIAVILAHSQGGQGLLQLLTTIFPGCFPAPGGKDLVGVVVVMVVCATGHTGVTGGVVTDVVVVVFMPMLMMMLVFMGVVMFMLVVVMVMAATVTVVVVVMMLVFNLSHQIFRQSVATLHGSDDLAASKLIPGGGEDGRLGIFFPKDVYKRQV